jgi:hypothetical protein
MEKRKKNSFSNTDEKSEKETNKSAKIKRETRRMSESESERVRERGRERVSLLNGNVTVVAAGFRHAAACIQDPSYVRQ